MQVLSCKGVISTTHSRHQVSAAPASSAGSGKGRNDTGAQYLLLLVISSYFPLLKDGGKGGALQPKPPASVTSAQIWGGKEGIAPKEHHS